MLHEQIRDTPCIACANQDHPDSVSLHEFNSADDFLHEAAMNKERCFFIENLLHRLEAEICLADFIEITVSFRFTEKLHEFVDVLLNFLMSLLVFLRR